MFKRLKDKITEEVKISPSKFSASVQQWQQMAQAVVSPTANSVIDAPSMDSFSIDGDYDETPQNSPSRASSLASESTPGKSSSGDPSTFTLVDLQESSATPVSGYASSRRSSFASTTSESPAILFPVLETGTANHFQSDLESCSERDESIFSSNVDNVSKEQLLSAFRKTQQRYHKYKGRYTDLIRHYRELERENTKARTVLAECQDKALRRAAELKEQCQLEQKAKAHLEEVLRSDLEEKDHLIHTLETKIQLLKSGVDPTKVLSAAALTGSDAPADAADNANSDASLLTGTLASDELKIKVALSESEVEKKLQEKVTKLEELVQKCKEAVRVREERISQLEKDKESLTDREAELQSKMKALQLQEEETSLSVAENKLMVHQELESKEEVIRQLNKQLASANARSSDLQREIEQLQEGFKKDLAAGKQEASRLIQAEMQNIVAANRKLEELLVTRDQQLSDHEASLSAANLRLQELQGELESVRESKLLEVSRMQATIGELESALARTDLSSRLEPVLKPLQEIRVSAEQLRGELTESLKATESFIQDSVQDIHSRSSQLLAESTQELNRLRENQDRSETEKEELLEKIQQLETSLKHKEDSISSFETQILQERKLSSDLKKALENLEIGIKEHETAERGLEEQLQKNKLAMEEYRKELEEMREGRLSAESSEKKFVEELQQQVKSKEIEVESLSRDLMLLKDRLEAERFCYAEELRAKADCVPPLEAQIDSLKTDNARLLEEQKNLADEKSAEIVAMEEKNVSLAKEVQVLKTERNKLSEEIGKLEEVMVENEAIQISEIQKLETLLNEKNLESEQLRNSMNVIQASCNSLMEEFSVLSRKLEDSEQKCWEWKSKVVAAEVEVCEKEQLMTALEAQVATLSGSASDLTVLKEEKEELLERVALLESRLTQCSQEFQDKEVAMEEKHVELGNLLNLKTQELQELKQELDLCKTELSNKRNLLELKTSECASLVAESSAYADDLNTKSMELVEKVRECEELGSKNAVLAKEKEDARAAWEEEKEILKKEIREVKEKFNEVMLAKENLETELKTLSEEHASQTHALKLKTDECAEKEAQLDNLADEMKRVDELSQELGRISDESEANVQVLSAEASSLAQKVEELTAKTQQMKEREVELVAKAQMADACQAEFLQLKEAKAELQAKLSRAEKAEAQLALLKEAQAELGNRLKQAEAFEKQCEHLKELASNVPDLEAKCSQLREAQERVAVLERKCAQLNASQEKVRVLEEEFAQLKEAQALLIDEQKKVAALENQCAQLNEAQEKIRVLEEECAQFKETQALLIDEQKKVAALESQCAQLNEAQVKVRVLEEECAQFKETQALLIQEQKRVAALESQCAQLQEAQERVSVLEERCVQLEGAEERLSQLQTEFDEFRDLSSRHSEFINEQARSNASLKLECSVLNTEMGKNAVCSEELKIRCVELEEKLKESSDLQGEVERLREESLEFGKLREEYKHLSEVEEKLKSAHEECDRLKKECAHLNDLNTECEALRSENARIRPLEEELSHANQQLREKNTADKDEGALLDEKRSLQVEAEVQCEDLREQLRAAKSEIDDLRSDLEFVRTVPIERPLSPTKKQRITSLVTELESDHSVPMPVVEEPIVAKKVKDLFQSGKVEGDDSEDDDNDEDGHPKIQRNWKEAYESLLEEHKVLSESNQQIIDDLKEQLKLKEEKPRKKPWERKEQEKTSFAALESKALGTEGNSVSVVEGLQTEIAGLQTQLKDSKRQHRQEVSELRRMLLNNSHGVHGACTLEDATELEYLRNILYEYMMGKEPMVLARVIAAVVKFDSEQTKKILQKEEQRLTLLGHLGIS